MKRRYRLAAGFIGFLLVLLIALLGQPSLGFTVTGNKNGETDKTHRTYTSQDGKQFSITILPIEKLPRGGTEKLKTALKDKYPEPEWKFITASEDIKGVFDIDNYYACSPTVKCKIEYPYFRATQWGGPDGGTNGIGASIKVDYVPKSKDLILSRASVENTKLHWIQYVEDTDDIPNKFIDITDKNGGKTPFYDTGNQAWGFYPNGTFYFLDVPYRCHSSQNPPDEKECEGKAVKHTWKAELYLVQQPDPNIKSVTIYNGISWGWHNELHNDNSSNQPSEESLRAYAESYIKSWGTRPQNGSLPQVSPINSLIISRTDDPKFSYSGNVITEAYPALVFGFYHGSKGWVTAEDRANEEKSDNSLNKPSEESLRAYAESYIKAWGTRPQNGSLPQVSPINSLDINRTDDPKFPYSGNVITEAYPALVFGFYHGSKGWVTAEDRANANIEEKSDNCSKKDGYPKGKWNTFVKTTSNAVFSYITLFKNATSGTWPPATGEPGSFKASEAPAPGKKIIITVRTDSGDYQGIVTTEVSPNGCQMNGTFTDNLGQSGYSKYTWDGI